MHFQFRLNMLIEELPVLPRHFTGKGGRRTPTGINDDRDAMFRLSRLALILSSALVAAPAAAQLVPGETPTEDQVTSGEVLAAEPARSEEHTSELQSLMRISYAVFCLKKKK